MESKQMLPDAAKEKRVLGEAGKKAALIAGSVGFGAIAVAILLAMISKDGWRSFLFSYLLNFSFVLSLALGALFFVILEHLTKAGWSVVLRRLAEMVASSLPFLAVLAIPILIGVGQLYEWSHADALATNQVLQAKKPYLNVPFFALRLLFYFATWTLITRYFVGSSLKQDSSGDAAISLKLQRRAAPAMLAFALTVTFAAIDLLMSLNAHWSSTIFGVYFFAGSVVGCVALLIVSALSLQNAGFLRRIITVEHYHDLGKLLFAFTVFWAYIAFSQFMLMWYANLPEETVWYQVRMTHGWGGVGLVLLFGHFLFPFGLLLSRTLKRKPELLVLLALWMLVMHWVDLYYLVIPTLRPTGPGPGLMDVALFLGLVGVTLAFVLFFMGNHSLLAEGDPRLEESLAFENA